MVKLAQVKEERAEVASLRPMTGVAAPMARVIGVEERPRVVGERPRVGVVGRPASSMV